MYVVVLALLSFSFLSEAGALDQSYAHVLGQMHEHQAQASRSLPFWSYAVAAAAVILIVLFGYLQDRTSRKPGRRSTPPQEPLVSFHVQARELGFSTAQARALEQVAKTVARWPGALLVDAKGRGLLSTQLGRRINRRSRQAALLTATRTHLDGVREGGQVLSGLRSAYPELSVWVAPATAPKVGADAPDADSWGPAAGVLEAISPAGMSVRMQEEAETGDLLEVWSADPQAPFASVRAGVTSVDVDGPTKRYHLHMLDIGQRQMVELVEQMRRASGISRGDNGLTQGEAAAPVTPRFTWNNLEVVFPAKEEIEEHCRAWTHDFPFLRGVGAEIERGADGTVLRLAAQVPHGELCSCLHTDMKNLGSAAEAACDQLSQLLERYAASREPRRAH